VKAIHSISRLTQLSLHFLSGAVEGLLKPEAKADLTSILTYYHVVAGNVNVGDLSDGQMVTSF